MSKPREFKFYLDSVGNPMKERYAHDDKIGIFIEKSAYDELNDRYESAGLLIKHMGLISSSVALEGIVQAKLDEAEAKLSIAVEALEHYESAHYDHDNNPCYLDITAKEALAKINGHASSTVGVDYAIGKDETVYHGHCVKHQHSWSSHDKNLGCPQCQDHATSACSDKE